MINNNNPKMLPIPSTHLAVRGDESRAGDNEVEERQALDVRKKRRVGGGEAVDQLCVMDL